MEYINIAIDGPAGAGKSSVAKAAAKRLGYIYVDTGALYRTIAYCALKNSVDTQNADEIKKFTAKLADNHIGLDFIDGEQHVFAGDEDVSDKIRTPEISMAASKVSAVPEVRAFLFGLQRKIAAENNVIMDGRDIGTVVLPNAKVKIFLTASAEKRADRRFKELSEKGDKTTYDKILEEIKERDYNDSHRAVSPLKMADDAVLCDTSEVDLEGAVEMIMKIIRSYVD